MYTKYVSAVVLLPQQCVESSATIDPHTRAFVGLLDYFLEPTHDIARFVSTNDTASSVPQ